uniref:(northern house mosquito) hypothetical protein n=1 Tax=Culex pipiens TaxID=7175 RepID=A0A8D8MA56_CULPI
MSGMWQGIGQQGCTSFAPEKHAQRRRSTDDLRYLRAGIPKQGLLRATRPGTRRNRLVAAVPVSHLPEMATRRAWSAFPSSVHALRSREDSHLRYLQQAVSD